MNEQKKISGGKDNNAPTKQGVTDTNVGDKNCGDCSRRKWYQKGYADGIEAAKVKNCFECSGCQMAEDDGK